MTKISIYGLSLLRHKLCWNQNVFTMWSFIHGLYIISGKATSIFLLLKENFTPYISKYMKQYVKYNNMPQCPTCNFFLWTNVPRIAALRNTINVVSSYVPFVHRLSCTLAKMKGRKASLTCIQGPMLYNILYCITVIWP